MPKKQNNKIVIVLLVILILLAILNVVVISRNKPKKEKQEIELKFRDFKVQDKYYNLIEHIGKHSNVELDSDGFVNGISWQSPLDKFVTPGKFGGLDLVKLSGYITRKYHPIPAPCFVIVGKYMNVPEHLMGPLKYASETINIEQLFVPKKYNDKYEKTGEKEMTLVTGSCASITISAITLQFVMDMIELFKDNTEEYLDLQFREEYDKRVLNYLCGGGVKPEMNWFSPLFFGEEEVYNGEYEQCKKNNIQENFGHGNHNSHNDHNNSGVKCSDFGEEDCPTLGPDPSCKWKDDECKSS